MKQNLLAGERYGLFSIKILLATGCFLLNIIDISAAAVDRAAVDQSWTPEIVPSGTTDAITDSGRLKIRSKYSQLLLEGVRLSLPDGKESYFTNQEGVVTMPLIEGTPVWNIAAWGFRPRTMPVEDRRPTSRWIDMDPVFTELPQLTVGDSIPDAVLDRPFKVVQHPSGRTSLSLRELQQPQELLVMVYWARYCAPCIQAVRDWECLAEGYSGKIKVLNVLMDYEYKALPSLSRFAMESVCALGDDVVFLNDLFFNVSQVGQVVMLREGRVMAIPKDKGLDRTKLEKILGGEFGIYDTPADILYIGKEGMNHE